MAITWHEIKSLLCGKRRYIVDDGYLFAEFFEYSELAIIVLYEDYEGDIKIHRVGRFDWKALSHLRIRYSNATTRPSSGPRRSRIDSFLKDERVISLMESLTKDRSFDRLSINVVKSMLFIKRREVDTQEYLNVGGFTLPDYDSYDDFVAGTLGRLEEFLITNIHLMDYSLIGVPKEERAISYKPKYYKE